MFEVVTETARSMGMQWCTEFTQLIPNNKYREHIVGYMRALKRDSFIAMHKSLNAAEMGGGCDPNTDDVDGGRKGEEQLVPSEEEELLLPPPPSSISPSALASSVAMAALVNAAINCVWDVRCILRTVIVAYDIQGRCPPPNYKLSGGQMMRSTVRPKVGFFQEQILREFRKENHTPTLNMPLDKLRDTFGRTSYILRLVCTVNARHAWPGDARTVGVRPRAGGAHPPPPPLRTRVDALRDRVHRLMAMEPVVVTAYSGDHPLYGTLETSTLMRTFLSRLYELLRDIQNITMDDDTVSLCNQHWLADLNRMWVQKELGGPADNNNNKTEAPQAFFLMYTQLADELQFLRRIALFDRNRIIGSLGQGTAKARQVDCPLPGGYPPIGARLTVRRYTDWQQAYRTLFPFRYNLWKTKQAANNTTVAVYYTRLSLNSPYANAEP